MKKWKVVAVDDMSPFMHGAAYFTAAVTRVAPVLRVKEQWAIEFRGKTAYMAVEPSEWIREGQLAIEKLSDEKFFTKVCEKNVETVEVLLQYVASLLKTNFAQLTNAELFSTYEKVFSLWMDLNEWGHWVNLVDFDHFLLSKKIMTFLEKRVAGKTISTAEAFSLLLTPNKRSELQQQDIDFYNLIIKMQEGKNIKDEIKKHADKYKWMEFHYDGPTVLGADYFSASLTSAAKQGASGKSAVEKILNHEAEISQKQKSLELELGLSHEELYWIYLAKEFTYLKTLRKETVFQACCDTCPLLKEIAKRLNLSSTQVKFITLEELKASLEQNVVNVEEINRRTQHCVALFENGISFYTGEKARELAAMIYEEKVGSDVKELKGTPAFPGNVKGIVKILRNAEDMAGFQPGNVLVSPATNPNLISAMKIASAIVTDEGGITCHAAIVSRELKVPCVIGTKVATKWLKDGDQVEIDATKGIVRKV